MVFISWAAGVFRSFRERDDHLIRDDFSGDRDYDIENDRLLVSTPLGRIPIPGDMRYDRFTGVYDTEYPSFWKASAFHDLACGEGYELRNEEGAIVATERWITEAIFLYLMMAAVRNIIVEAIQYRQPHYITDARSMLRRALRYHMGVRLFGPKKGKR